MATCDCTDKPTEFWHPVNTIVGLYPLLPIDEENNHTEIHEEKFHSLVFFSSFAHSPELTSVEYDCGKR